MLYTYSRISVWLNQFVDHVKEVLRKSNKTLYVIRSLRKEGYSQKEVDHLFQTLILSRINYGISVYGSSSPELNSIQCFLDRCYKRKYHSHHINIHSKLEKSDLSIAAKANKIINHPLKSLLPVINKNKYHLRNKSFIRPAINTERFKNSFSNRLIFKY